jgi:hypothetical protein
MPSTFQHLNAIGALQRDDIRVAISCRLQGLGNCVELLFCIDKANGPHLGCVEFLPAVYNGMDCHIFCSSISGRFESRFEIRIHSGDGISQ